MASGKEKTREVLRMAIDTFAATNGERIQNAYGKHKESTVIVLRHKTVTGETFKGVGRVYDISALRDKYVFSDADNALIADTNDQASVIILAVYGKNFVMKRVPVTMVFTDVIIDSFVEQFSTMLSPVLADARARLGRNAVLIVHFPDGDIKPDTLQAAEVLFYDYDELSTMNFEPSLVDALSAINRNVSIPFILRANKRLWLRKLDFPCTTQSADLQLESGPDRSLN
jgi:hypothetical protein